MQDRLNISYITSYAAKDVQIHSGVGYFLAHYLEKQQDVQLEYIEKLKGKYDPWIVLKWLYYRKVNGKVFDYERDLRVANWYAKQIERSVSNKSDVLFSPGSIPISLVKTNKPIAFCTDATFDGLMGFFDSFSNFCDETIRNARYLEKKALENTSLAIYSSDWAAQTAIKYYGADSRKIRVVPRGANLENTPTYDEIKFFTKERIKKKKCNLLFIAKDWNRKGGETVLRVAEYLNKNQFETIVHVVGVEKLPAQANLPYVVNHGYIGKSTGEGQRKISELLAQCHFLLLPTKADCSPLVLSEANAHALPCLTSDVGGIPSVIKNDVNGKVFSLNASAEEYATYILTLFQDQSRYENLCYSSYHEFESRLNWTVATKTIVSMLKEL